MLHCPPDISIHDHLVAGRVMRLMKTDSRAAKLFHKYQSIATPRHHAFSFHLSFHLAGGDSRYIFRVQLSMIYVKHHFNADLEKTLE